MHTAALPEQALLDRIDLFLQATGMSPSAFGTAAAKDHKFVKTLRDGRNLSVEVRQRVIDYMAGVKAQVDQSVEGAKARVA